MDELEKRLVFLYTIIAIVLIALYLFVLFRKKLLKWSFVILLVFPISCIGLFFMFVTTYSFTEALIKDNFVLVQIITNWLNIWLIYLIITNIKRRK